MKSLGGLARPPSPILPHKEIAFGRLSGGEGLSAPKPMKTSRGAATSPHTPSCPFCNPGLSRRGGSSGIPRGFGWGFP